jgi:hypothetical protein
MELNPISVELSRSLKEYLSFETNVTSSTFGIGTPPKIVKPQQLFPESCID